MQPGELPIKKIVRGSQMIESYALSARLADDSVIPYPLTDFADIRMTVRRSDNPFGDEIYTLSLADGDITLTKKPVYSVPDDSGEPELLYELDVMNINHSSSKTLLFEADEEHYRDILFLTTGGEALIWAKGILFVIYNKTNKP